MSRRTNQRSIPEIISAALLVACACSSEPNDTSSPIGASVIPSNGGQPAFPLTGGSPAITMPLPGGSTATGGASGGAPSVGAGGAPMIGGTGGALAGGAGGATAAGGGGPSGAG